VLPNTIMIIEDEAITQRYLKDIIHHLNIELVGYFDGSEGVMERLQSTQPDMILMDINLKGAMDGIELTRKILSKYQIPIVFITAYHDDNTVEEVIELSPYGFVIKPFTSKGIQIALKLAYKKFITHHKDIAKHSLNPTSTPKSQQTPKLWASVTPITAKIDLPVPHLLLYI